MDLTPFQQQFLIAQYITRNLLDSNKQDAQARHQRVQSARQRNKPRNRGRR